MAEYITKEQAFELLDDGDMYARKALAEMKPADVIERSKIDKAVEEIEKESYSESVYGDLYKETTKVISVEDVLEIFKRNIGE